MEFSYWHQKPKKYEIEYNFNLIRWLVERGFIPKDREIKILDLASGRGHFYFALKKLGYKNVSAVDLDPKFRECIKGDITKGLPLKNQEFDLIISRDIAEHILDTYKFFSEHHRILKKKGRVIIMTPNAKHLSLGEFFDDYTHCTPYTMNSLCQALQMHGFEKIFIKRLRAIPLLWRYNLKAFDFLFSKTKNNLLGVAIKK